LRYPIELMPDWLNVVATLNPLGYMVDAARRMMIVGRVSERGLALDSVVLVGTLAVLLWITARLYPRRSHSCERFAREGFRASPRPRCGSIRCPAPTFR